LTDAELSVHPVGGQPDLALKLLADDVTNLAPVLRPRPRK
jgi:hypothetical protein